MPSYFHNALTVVGAALLGATLIKGFCDYAGTYLVNYAGFGLVTDLIGWLLFLVFVTATSLIMLARRVPAAESGATRAAGVAGPA